MQDVLSPYLSPYLLSLVVSTGIGLIIGLEREFRKANERDHFAGIRTFPLAAILGCIITFASLSVTNWLIVVALFAFILFVSATYYIRSSSGHSGVTTEISLIIAFVLGAMTSLHLIREALAAAVITTTLLSLKGKFHTFIQTITEDELFAFIKFIILCMLLLPFLPDAHFGPGDILNPQEIGLIVVIVSSLSFIAYLLIKFTGTHKGILLTAFFGGLFSSTAVTWMLSSRSRADEQLNSTPYAAGIILAGSIMFLRAALVTLIFNKAIFLSLIMPCSLMFLTGLAFVIVLMRKEKDTQPFPEADLGNPINIVNALGFGILYIAIALLVYYANKYLGNRGLILSGLISGLADVDAITINISKLATVSGSITLSAIVILIAMTSNTIVKIGIALAKGAPRVRKSVSLGLGAAILAGILSMFLNSSLTSH